MNKTFTLLTALLIGCFMVYDAPYSHVHSNDDGAPAGRTGSPGDNSTCFNNCHGGNPGNGNQNEVTTVNHDIPVDGYIPGTTYNVSVECVGAGTSSFGFSLTCEDAGGNNVGTLISGSGTQTNGGGNHITHTETAGVGSKTWNFQWTAPTAGTGTITFYTASIYGNSNGNNSGDFMVLAENGATENVGAGILEVTEGEIGLFPNPATTEVSFGSRSVDEPIAFEIYDLTGKLVQQGQFEVGEMPTIELNRAAMVEGMYLLKLTDDRTELIQKLLIK